MTAIFVPAGLPASFAPVPAATPDGYSGGSVLTVGTLAAVVPHEPGLLASRITPTGRRGAWSGSGSDVVPDVHGGTFITSFNPGAALGPGGRTRRYNVDPIPSTSGASVQVNTPTSPRAPSGPSIATQPWPRVTPVWPVRRRF